MLCCAIETVDKRRDDHRESAGDAALDAANDGIGFDGQMRAVLGAETNALDELRARWRC